MRRAGFLTATALTLLTLATPYLLTVWSSSSLCFTGGPQIVSGNDKIVAVLDFLVRQGALTPAERTRIDPATCCRVDKGGGEVAPIGLENFIFGGFSHFVHVPAALIPRYDRLIVNIGEREGLFGVDTCGAILTRG